MQRRLEFLGRRRWFSYIFRRIPKRRAPDGPGLRRMGEIRDLGKRCRDTIGEVNQVVCSRRGLAGQNAETLSTASRRPADNGRMRTSDKGGAAAAQTLAARQSLRARSSQAAVSQPIVGDDGRPFTPAHKQSRLPCRRRATECRGSTVDARKPTPGRERHPPADDSRAAPQSRRAR